MNIENSSEIRNRIHVRSVIIAIVLYAFIVIATYGLALVLLLPCALLAFYLTSREIDVAKSTSNVFKKSFPLKYFGQAYGDFEHVFYFSRNLESEILETVIRQLRKKTSVQSIDPMTITDADRNLKKPESRLFLRADAGQTARGTTITLIMKMTSFGNMQSVQWWVLGGGYIDRDKRFNFVAYAALTIWFWIIPYLKKEYDLLARVRTVYPGSYNSMDVTTRVRCLHDAVFEAMVEQLDKNGIDTSDIKMQRAQVMNIKVSGGQLSVGNLMQGAMNRVNQGIARARGSQS